MSFLTKGEVPYHHKASVSSVNLHVYLYFSRGILCQAHTVQKVWEESGNEARVCPHDPSPHTPTHICPEL